MLRIRQQYWFCLAAVCLVGSLIMLWSTDIEIAEQRTAPPLQGSHAHVLRSLEDLPTTAFADENQLPLRLDPTQSGNQHGQTRILAPTAVPGRMASPLNTTARIVPVEQVTPAGYQLPAPTSSPQPVWLSGKIESLETVH